MKVSFKIRSYGERFIHFCLHWIFVAVHGLSLAAVSRGYSSLYFMGLLQWFLLLQSTGSRHAVFSICGMWAQQFWLTGPRVCGLQQLWCMGLVGQWPMDSSQTRDRTHVPRIGRQILICCTVREVCGESLIPKLYSFHSTITPDCPQRAQFLIL